MLSFRNAKFEDAENIAALHALSWQQNYRGVFSNHFLDNKVVADRLLVWRQRLKHPKENQFVYIVEDKSLLLGFVCVYFNNDSIYGTLIDNLHVKAEFSGQGIGEKLIRKAASEISQRNVKQSMYLWVLSNNNRAIKFYKRLGGELLETVNDFDIGDCEFTKTRIYWSSLRAIKKSKNEH